MTEPLQTILDRREAVIRILERDAQDAHAKLANALGTRKVLWNLLGECLPLLEQDAHSAQDYESSEGITSLIQRINDARAVVHAEELPGQFV